MCRPVLLSKNDKNNRRTVKWISITSHYVGISLSDFIPFFLICHLNNNKKGTVNNCYAAKVTLKTDATITADTFLNASKGLSNCYVLDSDNNTIKRVTVKDEAWFKSDEAIAALGGACEKGNDGPIVQFARKKGVKITFVDKTVLDKTSAEGRHQGYIADVTDFGYCEIEDILATGHPFVVVLDDISDPHNFGSIIRVCECAGVDGIVVGRNHQVAVNETVVRCSAGATAHMKIARVTNVNNAIKQLQAAGVWVYALDMDGEEITEANLTGSVALVVGSEGKGIGRLTRELCDGVVSMRLCGKVNSLNASVACGIAVYEVVRQRAAEAKK
mgnify:CR=1 FL=1